MNSLGRKKDDDKKEDNAIFTKELMGMVLILFASITLVCLVTGEAVFSTPGQYVKSFLLGVFGFSAYAVDLGLVLLGIKLVSGKPRIKANKKFILILGTLLTVLLLVHTITAAKLDYSDYGAYLSSTYSAGTGSFTAATAGGVVYSLISYLPVSVIGNAGTYAVLGVIIALMLYLTVKSFMTNGAATATRAAKQKPAKNLREFADDGLELKSYPVRDAVPMQPEQQKTEAGAQLYFRDDNFELKTKREMAAADKKSESFRILYPNYKEENKGLGLGSAEPVKPTDDLQKKIAYIKTPRPIEVPKYDEPSDVSVSRPVRETPKELEANALPPMFEHDDELGYDEGAAKRMAEYNRYTEIEEESVPPVKAEPVSRTEADEPRIVAEKPEPTNVPPVFGRRRDTERAVADEPTAVENNDASAGAEERLFARAPRETEPAQMPQVKPRESVVSRETFSQTSEKTEIAVPTADEPKEFVPRVNRVYNRPPLDLFKVYKQDVNAPQEDHEERSRIIERTLTEFGIDAHVVNYIQGPTVTRYEIMMPAGVSVKKVPNHADDIAMRLESENGVRIEAPIPGKNLVGIEVPNKVKTMVGLRDILESDSFRKSKAGMLTFALGKDIVGNSICDNLAKGPHYLVAGSTGMGKSVCLNTMIISMITKYSPEELRIILIDPKQVEFTVYNHLPHLMIDEIITNAQKAIATLQWAVNEMEERYSTFRDNEVRDIDEYNEIIASESKPKIPKLVIIVDEVSDLMQYNKRDLEAKILSLSQKARAAGIHLVLATQRPSVDVITGVIKTNLPSRIAFRVSNAIDSGTILSEGGAEKLLGNGDMLYRNAQMPKCERVQGAYIGMPEVKSVVGYIKENNDAYFNDKAAADIENAIKPPAPEMPEADETGERTLSEDKLFIDALRHVINSGSASISMLQRRFSVGYSKAGALVDKMDRLGYVSPFDGSRARQVLITREEFEDKYGEL